MELVIVSSSLWREINKYVLTKRKKGRNIKKKAEKRRGDRENNESMAKKERKKES